MDSVRQGYLEISGRAYDILFEEMRNHINESICFSGKIVRMNKPIKISVPTSALFKSDSPFIKNVIFNDPATIVIWDDGSKTVVKCQPGDVYSKELGLAMCISKKFLGNKGNFNEVFKTWIPND